MKHPKDGQRTVSRRSALLGAAGGMLALGRAAQAQALDGEFGEAPAAMIRWRDLTLIDGSTVDAAAWSSRPAIVVFWQTWCPFCKRHNAQMEALFESAPHAPYRILGASTESDKDKVARYVQANGIHFPVAMVDQDFRHQFSARRVIPLTCLVAAGGRVLQVIAGEMAADDVQSLARTLG